MREVADRLDADPSLITRRVASAGRVGTSRRAAEAPPADERDASAEPAHEAPRALNARERRELGLLAMCVRMPTEGRDVLDRLTPEHFSRPAAARAWAWIRDHVEDPLAGLSRDDPELLGYVTDVKMRSEQEPASPEAMELSLLELERAKVDDEIAAAESNGSPPVELQRRRAQLTERIARAQS